MKQVSMGINERGSSVKRNRIVALAAVVAMVSSVGLSAQVPRAHLTIDTSSVVSPVSPTLYGLMTEEINHAFDGGLYAEQVQNRTFRADWAGIEHWNLVRNGDSKAAMELDKTDGPSKALPYSLKLTVTSAGPKSEAGITNSGFWGIAVKPGTVYSGSFYAKADQATGPVTIRIVSDTTGKVLTETQVPMHAGGWENYAYKLTTAGSVVRSSENHLQLILAHAGTVRIQLVSLMPPTFHNRANGNRTDLMEKMEGLHPHFLRLPGGNYLEGDKLEDWYNFKETIGPLVDRPGHQAPWTYWSTDGMGLLEFLEWCEDLKIEPVLAVYAGYSLQGAHVAAGKDLEPYVKAALDEVEYVTGDVSTKWGAERAKDGHPAPFPLHYIEIGNEDWLDRSGSYETRYPQFARALRKAYPQYKLISTAVVKPTGPDVDPDVQDDHYYKFSGDMLDFVKHYDTAPRTGPKIFVGEWATLSGSPTPDFGAALADAAWMTSMERNSDLIVMSAYAPLLVNVNPQASQWGTNLIGYDAMTSYASPSYYAQSLFAGHLGDGTVKTEITGAGERLFYSATVSSADRVLHLKLVNASDQDAPMTIDLQGVTGVRPGKMTSLHAATFEATNSIKNPNFIHPVDTQVRLSGGSWKHTVTALSIEVLDIPLR